MRSCPAMRPWHWISRRAAADFCIGFVLWIFRALRAGRANRSQRPGRRNPGWLELRETRPKGRADARWNRDGCSSGPARPRDHLSRLPSGSTLTPTSSASSPESPSGRRVPGFQSLERQVIRLPAGIKDDAAELAQRPRGLRLAKCGGLLRAAGHPEQDSLAAGQRLLAANAEAMVGGMRPRVGLDRKLQCLALARSTRRRPVRGAPPGRQGWGD